MRYTLPTAFTVFFLLPLLERIYENCFLIIEVCWDGIKCKAIPAYMWKDKREMACWYVDSQNVKCCFQENIFWGATLISLCAKTTSHTIQTMYSCLLQLCNMWFICGYLNDYLIKNKLKQNSRFTSEENWYLHFQLDVWSHTMISAVTFPFIDK